MLPDVFGQLERTKSRGTIIVVIGRARDRVGRVDLHVLQNLATVA